MRLAGHAVLVTGGGTGIGAAVARRFAAEGADVAVMGRRREPLEAVATEVGGVAIRGDVSKPDDVTRAIASAVEHLGGLDVIVNNAGTGTSDWHQAFEINVTGPDLLVREAVPHLGDSGRGAIVNVSSIAGLVAGPANRGYAVSKAALIMLTRSLAVELGPSGIRVNAVCPGWVRTPMSEQDMEELGARNALTPDEAFRLVSVNVPLRRVGEPDEIASACLFLASSEASFVTGAVLVIDGGSTSVDVGSIAFVEGRDAEGNLRKPEFDI
jgi:meso-butanediol dehydrogenase/(S,S)-butanediol dehydrogenase/diacetyl reductase